MRSGAVVVEPEDEGPVHACRARHSPPNPSALSPSSPNGGGGIAAAGAADRLSAIRRRKGHLARDGESLLRLRVRSEYAPSTLRVRSEYTGAKTRFVAGCQARTRESILSSSLQMLRSPQAKRLALIASVRRTWAHSVLWTAYVELLCA
jgi:hypothetical protein